jgi:hypothetical protein
MKDNMIKKLSLIVLFITSLLFSLQASAGFREALSALQHKDAELMVVEVEKAIEAKNYDGASLFTTTLNYRYSTKEYLPQHLKDRLLFQEKYRLNEEYMKRYLPLIKVTYKQYWSDFLSEPQQKKLLQLFKKIKLLQDERTNSVIKTIVTNLSLADQHLEVKNLQLYHPNAVEKINDETSKKLRVKELSVGDRLALIKNAADAGSNQFKKLYGLLLMGDKEYAKFDEFGKTINAILAADILKADPERGYKMYEESVLNDEEYKWQGDISCVIGDAYYYGRFGKKQNYQQAYLWYVRGIKRYYDAENCSRRLLDLHKQNLLSEIAPELDKQILKLNEKIPYLDQTLELITLPDLIKEKRLISSDKRLIFLSHNLPYYQLEIFESGLVKYIAFNRNGYISVIQNAIIGYDEWYIPSEKVKVLISRLKDIDMEKISSHYESRFIDLSDEDFNITQMIITGSENEQYLYSEVRQKGLSIESNERSEVAAIKTIVEQFIPTHQLRCGEETITYLYKMCQSQEASLEYIGSSYLTKKEIDKFKAKNAH